MSSNVELDAEDEPNEPATLAQWRGFLNRLYLFVGTVAGVWVCLELVQVMLPNLKPGADVVIERKFDIMARQQMFTPADRVRILAFGDSKMMAGVVPSVFDVVAGPGVRMLNLGLPGRRDFLPILKRALKAGNRPTYVFLQVPWDQTKRTHSWHDYIPSDYQTLQTLFPFHSLARNLFVFLGESKRYGGVISAYRLASNDAALVLRQDGYYFIRAQSHYAHDRLPADYRLPTDTPGVKAMRTVAPQGSEYLELQSLQRTYGFKVVLIPTSYRIGEFAPPDARPARLTPLSGEPGIYRLGPDYVLFPTDHFADPVHLNPPGAAAFTEYLAKLFVRAESGAGGADAI